MLRINLLPPYVFDKQKKMQVWAIWGIVTLMVIGIFAYANKTATDKQEVAQAENDEAKKQQGLYNGLVTQISGVQDKIKATKEKQDFIASAKEWNGSWPDLFRDMRNVTSPKIILRHMWLTANNTVSIAAWAANEADAADWWMKFRSKYTGPNGPFETVSFELPKNGYPPGVDDKGGSSPYGGGASTSVYSPYAPYLGASGRPQGGGFGGGPTAGGGGNNTAPGAAMVESTSSNTKDDEVGPGSIEDRQGIFFKVRVVLKTPFDKGKPVPAWGAAPADASANPTALAAPGAPGRPPGAPAGAPPGGKASSSDDAPDSGATGKRRGKARDTGDGG